MYKKIINKNRLYGILIIMAHAIFSLTSCSSNSFDATLNKMDERYYSDDESHQKLPYRLFVPRNYNKNFEYPLVVILHGGGERGNDNKSQITIAAKTFTDKHTQDKTPCFVFAPQCPKGTQWLNTTFKKTPFKNYNQKEIPESTSMKIVVKIIDLLKTEFTIDSCRVYVTGYSMGGSGTWDIISRYPKKFAAAVPVTGVSDPSTVDLISHIPIWVFHGSKDTITPVQVTKNMVHALKKAGSKCKFTEYKNVAHDSWNYAYKEQEMFNWMFEQKN